MQIGDVYYADFPYDDENTTKRRPVICIQFDKNRNLFNAIKITSTFRQYDKYSIEINDLKAAGLQKKSYARCNNVSALNKDNIIQQFGRLTDNDLSNIINEYEKYYQTVLNHIELGEKTKLKMEMKELNKNNYPFTSDEIKAAYETSCVDIVEQYGLELKDEHEVYRVSGNGGLFLWKDGRGFYCQSTGEKGNNVEFLMKYCGVEKKTDAYRLLLNCANITPSAELSPAVVTQQKKKIIKLPEKFQGKFSNLYWYMLTERCIDKDVLYECLKSGSIYQDTHRNAVFCGFDNNRRIRYACCRGTVQREGRPPFKGEVYGSDKRFGFSMIGKSDRLYVFEAPIDAMSHASLQKLAGLDWKKDFRLSLGGCSDVALKQFLEDWKGIKQIVFCNDNDYCHYNESLKQWQNVGQEAVRKLAAEFKEKGYKVGKIVPPLPWNDFNEFLVGTVHPEKKEEAIINAKQEFCKHGSPELCDKYFPPETQQLEDTEIQEQQDSFQP